MSESARSYDARASAVRPSRRQNSARAEWASDGVTENPAYAPGLLALMERWPWLIYVLLAAASLALLAILVLLVLRMSKTAAPKARVEHRASAP